MSVIINASTTSGLVMTSDLSGNLQFQNNGVNLPMGGVAPAFSAYPSVSQGAPTVGVWTKITLDVEAFDTNNNYASSRFTPTVAGYYQLNGSVSFNTVQSALSSLAIYKNGNSFYQGLTLTADAYSLVVSSLLYLNGSTDYVELYTYTSISSSLANTQTFTYFNGSLVRGA
jgi:hypothetical protein